jgi:hypothetical protein
MIRGSDADDINVDALKEFAIVDIGGAIPVPVMGVDALLSYIATSGVDIANSHDMSA